MTVLGLHALSEEPRAGAVVAAAVAAKPDGVVSGGRRPCRRR